MYLVTGGQDHPGHYRYLSSTETLAPGAASWSRAAALPAPRMALRGVTMAGRLYITGTANIGPISCPIYLTFVSPGGWGRGTGFVREVLVYMPMYDKWKKTGDMETARDNHAVTRVQRSAVEQFCD